MLRAMLPILIFVQMSMTPLAGASAGSDHSRSVLRDTACPSGPLTASEFEAGRPPVVVTTGSLPWDYGAMRSYTRGFLASKFDPFTSYSFWFQVFEFPNSRFPAAWLDNYTVAAARETYASQGAPALTLDEIPFPFDIAGDGCRAFAGRLDDGEIHPRILVIAIQKERYVWVYSAAGIAADFEADLAPMIALIPEDPESVTGTGLSRFLPLPGEMPLGYYSIEEEPYPGYDSDYR